MKYKYYVTYQFEKRGKISNANTILRCTKKLDNEKNILEAQEHFRKEKKAKKLVILWWKKIK